MPLTRPLAPARVPDASSVLTVKTRTLKEAGREVLEILSDSEPSSDAEETTPPLPSSGPRSDYSSNFRESSPLPPSDFPSETSYTESDSYLPSDEHTGTVRGSYHCNQVNLGLLNVIRRDLDPASREAVFTAQRQTRREDGSTAERKVAEFLQLIFTQKCLATDSNGIKCGGVAILRSKKQVSRGKWFWVGCSGFTATSNGKHRSWTIPDDVDEPIFIKGMHGEPHRKDN
ncbi:hypothetical protein B0H14DRAFT_3497497 [Mycena olivaceomarginata]|nr:hypothetical protein B0H14DRAFT_3497497 [Mycena olivaceomarginata]